MKKLLYDKIIEIIGCNEYSINEILERLIKEHIFTTYETLRKDLTNMHIKKLIEYKYGKTELKKIPYRVYYIIK
jgi:hypothetical protein